MIAAVVLGLWILHLSGFTVHNVGALVEVNHFDDRVVDETLDERNDLEIFRAVVQSMNEWRSMKERKHHRSKREVSRVCYEDVGCFEDTGPFSYLEMLPSPPKDVGTRFFVYGSRKARSVPMEVPAESISDKANRAIEPELPTKVIVHGFGSSCDHVWVYEMRSALMAVIECNIVCVDWGPGSAVPNYVRAAANTRLVGRQLAKLVRSLNVSLEKVHLIGFSLGAHVAGFAGAELGNVSRITGLDPAGPLFESQDPRARLDETDARFVDVIHSNGEQLILGGLGSWQQMGDVDFYPNGGRMQSGCSNLFLGAFSDIIWSSAVEGRSLCNHRRAYKLFTDSISPKCRFPAFPCESGYDGLIKGECFPCGEDAPCGDMGFYSDKSPARGQLYLVTRDEEPFCAHQYQVKVYNSKHERPVKSYGRLQVTLIAEGSINETFTMTKKDDEELLVGATLQKIVVPHPVLSNLEAIEIKYTAYSGWISSGLVSWAVDKVSIIDSYGTRYAICKRGLILESGRPVYLSIYRGDCSVPPEINNTTLANTEGDAQLAESEQDTSNKDENKQKSIGPFTRDQNYDINAGKTSFTNEVSQKGLGPFTKDENIKIAKEQAKLAAIKENEDNSSSKKKYQGISNLWSIVELANDGASNSVENNIGDFIERGRSFSGLRKSPLQLSSALVTVPTSTAADTKDGNEVITSSPSTEALKPVLRLGKESGRSLKMSQITEPVLKPRSTRQDTSEMARSADRKHEAPEDSMSSYGFTVQFLPERLAGILAQAERYARRTLLPLISQYTPSFISGGRTDRPKYFPPLGYLFGMRDQDNKPEVSKKIGNSNDSRTKYYIEFKEKSSTSVDTVTETSSSNPQTTDKSNGSEIVIDERDHGNQLASEVDKTSTVQSIISDIITEKNEWLPVSPKSWQQSEHRKEKSVEVGWLSEGGASWIPSRSNDETLVTETKIDDWIPLVSYKNTEISTTNSTPIDENSNTDKKFIPLLEFGSWNESSKRESTMTEKKENEKEGRSIVFPYAYERKNDPRTRYIPLIPEEDLVFGGIQKESER